MRIRELVEPNIFVALTNEEADFLRKTKSMEIIHIDLLPEREQRIAENLIFKDILCKLTDTQLMVNEYVSSKNK